MLLPGDLQTVLIVDREEECRRAVQRLLSQQGYRVLTATNPGEGFACLSDWLEEVSVVILDFAVPALDRPLFRHLRTCAPALPIIITHPGWPAAGLAPCLDEAALVATLGKPLQAVELLACLRRILRAARQGSSAAARRRS
jgi:DNA-binding response OmpR family regulator